MARTKVRAILLTGVVVASLTAGITVLAHDAFGVPTTNVDYPQLDASTLARLLDSKLAMDVITNILREHPDWAESIAKFILEHFDISNLSREDLERLCQMFPGMEKYLAELMLGMMLSQGEITHIPEPSRSAGLISPQIDAGEVDPDADGIPLFTINTEQAGLTYLRSTSWGDYDTQTKTFGEAPTFDGSAYMVSPHFYSSIAASSDVSALSRHKSMSLHMLQGHRDYGTIVPTYADPYYEPEGYGLDEPIPFSPDAENRAWLIDIDDYKVGFTHDVKPLDMSLTSNSVKEQERVYRKFAKKNYTAVPESLLPGLQHFLEENYLETPDEIVGFLKQNYKYLPFAMRDCPSNEDLVLYFLNTKKAGICSNFASAATLLIRTLEIPARFVTGYMNEFESRVETEVTTKEAHAWVEYYESGKGWISVDPTPSRPVEELITTETFDGYINGNFSKDRSDQTVFTFSTTTSEGVTYLRSHSYGDYDYDTASFNPETESEFVIGTVPEYNKHYPQRNAEYAEISYQNGYVPIGQLEPSYSFGSYMVGVEKDEYNGNRDFLSENEQRRFRRDRDYTVAYNPDLDLQSVYTSINDTMYASFVGRNYSEVPAALEAKLQTYLEEEKLTEAPSRTICEHLIRYHRFDPNYVSEIDPVEDFLSLSHIGNEKTFAAAMTLLCRQAGQPARYVEGFAIENPEIEGSKIDVSRRDYRPWVEVFVEGAGWQRFDPLGRQKNPGVQKLEFSSKDMEITYDGKPHSATMESAIDGPMNLNELLNPGDELQVRFTATSQNVTEVGTYIINYRVNIVDHWGASHNDDYEITLTKGNVLTVVPASVTVTSTATPERTRVNNTVDRGVEATGLMADLEHHIDTDSVVWVVINWRQEGVYENQFDTSSIRILDQEGNDVTANYLIVPEFGTIVIEADSGEETP